ncbi:MAG TPA: tRNA (adenosine(37)-N6)-threonylcarbamoyltransferase complex transferase subunit TsaD [Acidobacteriota bacterium]
MLILGIETSCDETAVAVVEDGLQVRSSVVASQHQLHSEYGGVVPELAARAHQQRLLPLLSAALRRADLKLGELDALAVTSGPGLIGALLVGITAAKALSLGARKPLVQVNHLEAHLHSVLLSDPQTPTPAVALVVSGGHTGLYHVLAPRRYRLLGQTRDDAVGEALDKLAKLLRLGYPGGPLIEKLAAAGNPNAFRFAAPRIKGPGGDLDFSFSGLKTAAKLLVEQRGIAPLAAGADPLQRADLCDLAASYQEAAFAHLCDRLFSAAEALGVAALQLAGGVACNRSLRRRVESQAALRGLRAGFCRPEHATDNAAMVAGLGFFHAAAGRWAPPHFDAQPAGAIECEAPRASR